MTRVRLADFRPVCAYPGCPAEAVEGMCCATHIEDENATIDALLDATSRQEAPE